MKFYKTRDVRSPEILTKLSVGIDFFVPKFTESFLTDLFKLNTINGDRKHIHLDSDNKITLLPNSFIKIPLGIIANIGSENALIFHDKSSVSTKGGLTKLAGVIDSDYKDEYIVALLNHTSDIVFIEENKAIIQGIIIKKQEVEISEILDKENLFSDIVSDRDGGFGTTYNK